MKWFIPLTEVKLENQTQGTDTFCVNIADVFKVGKDPSHQSLFNYAEVPKNAAVRKQEVEALQKRVNVLQNELRREIRKNKFGDHVSYAKLYQNDLQ